MLAAKNVKAGFLLAYSKASDRKLRQKVHELVKGLKDLYSLLCQVIYNTDITGHATYWTANMSWRTCLGVHKCNPIQSDCVGTHMQINFFT